jgi:NAD kinase
VIDYGGGVDIPDFCVTLGGDGTVLYTASMFAENSALPPMLAFAMGTLGFLTPFQASSFQNLMGRCFNQLQCWQQFHETSSRMRWAARY